MASAPGAVLDQVLLRLALVALESVAVRADRVAGSAGAHTARPMFALTSAFALAEADEHSTRLILGHGREEGSGVLALALAFALALDNPPNLAGRLMVVETPPSGLGVLVSPEKTGSLLGRWQVLDVKSY